MSTVSYSRVNWVDRVVEYPRRYTETDDGNGNITHTPASGNIIVAGTPRSAENMNIMDKGIKDTADAHNELQEDYDAFRPQVEAHLINYENPHKVGFYQILAETLAGTGIELYGPPRVIGKYKGTGSGQSTITVNGNNRRGEYINLGFAPSVVIIFRHDNVVSPMTEKDITSGSLMDVLAGRIHNVIQFGPGANYYHNACGSEHGTSSPQDMLGRGHGGACVYGNGFIVSAYNNMDNDNTMRVNSKNVWYYYAAWD